MTMRRLLVGIVPCVALACFDKDPLPPQGQIVLGVTTDAWLPRGPTDPEERLPHLPLFERLRIELFAPGESDPCHECTRDFGIDHGTIDSGRASIGFVPRADAGGYRARIRLYHAGASESAAAPRPSSTLETVVALPVVGPDGITTVHVVLHTDDVSRPVGTLEAPAEPLSGAAPVGLAGTWRSDLVRDCAAPAADGEACVPGGAYWQGDPGFDDPYERLVGVSPFFIDTTEVLTGAVRASGLAVLDTTALTADPYLYSSDPAKSIHYCTYTQFAGTQEDLPVNCVTRDLARRFCEKRGARLVSEAELEFVAGARRDATFPWGEAAAGCADAVYGRTFEAAKPAPWHVCASAGIGVARPGSGRLDRVAMPDGHEVVDLAGNLAEWVRDEYQTSHEPCALVNPAIDPVCTTQSPSDPDSVAVRGEPWTDPGGSLLRAAVSSHASRSAPQNPRIGFRCARDDHP